MAFGGLHYRICVNGGFDASKRATAFALLIPAPGLFCRLVATPPQVSQDLAFSEPQYHQFDQRQRGLSSARFLLILR